MLKSSSLIPQLAFLYSFFDFLALFFFFLYHYQLQNNEND